MYFQGRFAPNHTTMTNNLTNIKTRNQLIVNFIDVLKSMGRKILILSYRVEHLELLKRLVDAKIEADGESHIYNSYYYTSILLYYYSNILKNGFHISIGVK